MRLQLETSAAIICRHAAAQKNIDDNGAIVADPRTGSPIPNPYLQVRDKAFARLETLHKAGVRAPGLWL
jgi:hypothetical protein